MADCPYCAEPLKPGVPTCPSCGEPLGQGGSAAAKKKPLGRLVSWAVTGVEPRIMGIGPVPAGQMALEKAGFTLDEIDLIEVNEAFAPQYLAVEKELGLDREKTNVNGGAIALGHPLGATGAILTLTCAYALRRKQEKYGVVTMCIGGGQGISLVLESI